MGGERKRSDSCIHGRDARLRRNQKRPLFVTSGYLAGHFRTRVGTYSGHCGLPDISMSCSKLPSNIIVVFDFSMSVGGSGFVAETRRLSGESNNLLVFIPYAHGAARRINHFPFRHLLLAFLSWRTTAYRYAHYTDTFSLVELSFDSTGMPSFEDLSSEETRIYNISKFTI